MRQHSITRRRLMAGAAGIAALGPVRVKAEPVLKVGVALVAPVTAVGWTKQHSLAAAAIKTAMGDAVEVSVVDNVFQPQDAERIFRGFAASGHRLVIGTSFSHGAPMAKVAPAFPGTMFDNCAGIKLLPNLGSFEAKYFEGAYIAGVAAGKMSKTGKIGFIGGFAVPDIVGPANALLLGAQSVNPAMVCTVIFLNSWEDPGKEKEAALALAAQGCDVLCGMTDSPVAVQVAEEAGLWSIGYASDMRIYGPTRQLTAYMMDWSSIYVNAAQEVASGTWKSAALWQGLKEGVVRLAPYAQAIPADVIALLADKEAAIKAGTLHPYAGELKDQDGTVRVPGGSVMSDADIRSMDFLVAGMIGRLKA